MKGAHPTQGDHSSNRLSGCMSALVVLRRCRPWEQRNTRCERAHRCAESTAREGFDEGGGRALGAEVRSDLRRTAAHVRGLRRWFLAGPAVRLVLEINPEDAVLAQAGCSTRQAVERRQWDRELHGFEA